MESAQRWTSSSTTFPAAHQQLSASALLCGGPTLKQVLPCQGGLCFHACMRCCLCRTSSRLLQQLVTQALTRRTYTAPVKVSPGSPLSVHLMFPFTHSSWCTNMRYPTAVKSHHPQPAALKPKFSPAMSYISRLLVPCVGGVAAPDGRLGATSTGQPHTHQLSKHDCCEPQGRASPQ